MASVSLILLVFAAAFFGISAFINPPNDIWRWRLIPMGLFFWVLSLILSGTHLAT